MPGVAFVECDVFERDAVACRTVILFDGDLPLWSINHFVGNARRTATFTILVPRLRQKQVLINERVKIVDRVCQVYRDDAVFLFADRTAILVLDTRRFVSSY